MKILDVLNKQINETFDDVDTDLTNYEPTAREPVKVSVSQLNTLQLRTLTRVATNEVDVDSASEKELDIILDLQGFGLLDDDFELTDAGREILTSDADAESKVGRVAATDDLDFDLSPEVDELDLDDDGLPRARVAVDA